jgi:DNA repair exonuclease SbcCD ATPase subunit
MEGAAAKRLEKNSADGADLDRTMRLKERLERLLREAAEVQVELSRADGTIRGIPHYSVIETQGHELGRQLSREFQQRQMNELAACQAPTAKCPTCSTCCELHSLKRDVKTIDGEVSLQELVGHCPCCRRDFFPCA